MKLLANLTGLLGNLFAKSSSSACVFSYLDEEVMPESLLK